MIRVSKPQLVAAFITFGMLSVVSVSWMAHKQYDTPKSPGVNVVVAPKTEHKDSDDTTTEQETAPQKSETAPAPVPNTANLPSVGEIPHAPAPTPSPVPTPSSSPGACANPYFTTNNSNGGVNDGGYYVHNNLWNASKYPGTTGTTYVCSHRSWNHTAVAVNGGAGEVKTFPNVHKNYSGRTVASFSTLTSSFAAISPSTGIYNVGYDMWLNGIPNDEIMIWTDNYNQHPSGSKFASNVSFSGYNWDIYATGGNGYIAFVPANGLRITSGSIDIKAMLDYLVAQGRISANATVDQIGYGIEIVDTGGVAANWYVTDFSITNN